MKVTMIDPPSRWKYGFPKVYNWDEAKETKQEWLIRNGYPKELIDKGYLELGCGMWYEEIEMEKIIACQIPIGIKE